MLRRLSLYFSLLVILTVGVSAQPNPVWDADCAVANDPDSGPWGPSQNKRITLADPDCVADVSFRERTCTKNGVAIKEYVITGWTLVQGCEGWDTKSLYHMKSDGLKEYVKLGFLAQYHSDPEPKNCDGADGTPETFTTLYTAACGVWTCCEYDITWPQTPNCDPYWTGPPPHYGEPRKVKACKWVTCGTVCCRSTYTICKKVVEIDSVSNRITYDIKLVGKVRLGECSGDLSKTTPPTPGAQPCLDGC